MRLTYESVERFEGGQAMTMHPHNGYMYLGEIKEISAEDGVPRIVFAWCAKSEAFHTGERKWVKAEPEDFPVRPEPYALRRMGRKKAVAGADSLRWLMSPLSGRNTIILFPPSYGDMLDPAEVDGLNQPTST